MIKREVKLENMLNRLIERDGYVRNRKPILDSIHITAAALSQYARGRTRPSFDKLLALAEFFGVSLDYLVYGEPTSAPVDPAPFAGYVEQALMDARASTNRHSELVAHIGRLLMDNVNEVAEELEKRLAGFEGLIETKDLLRVERHCQRADIVATDLKSDVIVVGEVGAVPGEFFPVVVDNLSNGCTYRFLLAGGLTTQSQTVIRFQEMISDSIGGDRLHEYCFFRTAASPTAGAPVLYELDISTFKRAESAIFAQLSKYLLDNKWLGYLNRPSNESTTTDMLMTPNHVNRARKEFEDLWSAATT